MNKKPYIALFEAAFLIGSRVNNDDPECLLTYSAGLFADAFLSREIDPRHPMTLAKYSSYQPTPRAGITTEIRTKKDGQPTGLGRIVIREIPDLSWQLTRKEVAEFAILKAIQSIFLPIC